MANSASKQKTVVAGALGECVHVAGVSNFLRLAQQAGWRTVFLGPAVPIERMLAVAREEKADLVGVSYRLTPETGERLLAEFAEEADELHSAGVQFAFAGTPPVVERADKLGFFAASFDGTESVDEVLAFLHGEQAGPASEADFPQTTVGRIQWKQPYPLIRHHFGLPTMEETVAGIQQIAEARALDVISIGTDQDAQENFFHPERQNPRRRGAGGVPVRSADDFRALYAASRRGNFPLLRTYTGTDDFLKLAEMFMETINMAWAAIPLFWFNKMDGRGPWDLEGSLREHQELMSWYGERGIPVELNEAHHWGMRDAPDVIFCVALYLAAYNAKAYGVHDHIVQMMFNSPPGLSDTMDLAKMLAGLELVSELEDQDFRLWRQTRTGLLSYPVDIEASRGHLAASVYLQMQLKPHIIHIVGHTEADHAATAGEVIAASQMGRRAIENALRGLPDATHDPLIVERKQELVAEARLLLDAVRQLAAPGVQDPLADAVTLAAAVETGILDAPQLGNNPHGRGRIRTTFDARGACISVDPETGKPITEKQRLNALAQEARSAP
ncbi:MAG: cobalamin B12-binding domain-containing protein [Anaerolineales bacterium]|nr:cobalamin B12-binding domain-containing protein [Anaerolineales bacterium]